MFPTTASFNKYIDAALTKPSFTAWFGESKIRSHSNKPQVCFHGTKGDFSNFQQTNLGADSRESPLCFWFTDSAQAASQFAAFSRGDSTPNLRPVFLKIEHPWQPRSYNQIRDLIDRHTTFKRPNYILNGRNIRMTGDKVDYQAARNELIQKGYDGIILTKTLTDSPDEKRRIDQYLVFSNDQIKPIFSVVPTTASTACRINFYLSHPVLAKSTFDFSPYGTLTTDLPKYLLHYTKKKEDLDSILKSGFDLKRFGRTGKEANQPDMIKHDPAGIYLTELDPNYVDYYRPFVICTLKGHPTALVSKETHGNELKVLISKATGLSGKPLTTFLLKHNIQVVKSLYEWIVLDPNLLTPVDSNYHDL